MMTLKQILKGYTMGQPQTVANFRVIPILTKTPFQKVSNMESIYLKEDVEYSRLIMANDSAYIGVIPQGLMYVTSESAQDRAIPSAHLIKKTKSVGADCLQPSQGGYMGGSNKEREFGVLPKSIRIKALSVRDDTDYDSLWPDMERFMRDAGSGGREIVKFFKQFKDELESFVAQFEPVEDQVGAVFIINDQLMGIEIMPNYETWKQMWRPLVRDCYGGEAVALNKKGLASIDFEPMINVSGIKSLDDIIEEVDRIRLHEKQITSDILGEYMTEELEGVVEDTAEDFTLYTIEEGRIVGQLAQHGPERFIYISLMSNDMGRTARTSKPKAFDSRWNSDSPYEKDSEFGF